MLDSFSQLAISSTVRLKQIKRVFIRLELFLRTHLKCVFNESSTMTTLATNQEKLLPIRSATYWTEDGIISTESELAAGRPFERCRSVQLDRIRRYLPTIVNCRAALRDALSRFRCRQ